MEKILEIELKVTALETDILSIAEYFNYIDTNEVTPSDFVCNTVKQDYIIPMLQDIVKRAAEKQAMKNIKPFIEAKAATVENNVTVIVKNLNNE